jgi:hypothetical protein
MAIDFQNPGERQLRIGKAQADIHRNPDKVPFGLTNDEILKLSRSSAQNMIRGTIEMNLRKKRSDLEDQKRVSGRLKTVGDFTNTGREVQRRREQFDPEIEALTKKIKEAARGKPAKVSISAERQKQRILGPFIARMLASMFAGGQEGETQQSGSGSTGTSPESSGSTSKPEQTLTPVDLEAITKAFQETQGDSGAEAKP